VVNGVIQEVAIIYDYLLTVFRMKKKGKSENNDNRINQAEFLSLFKKDTPSV
jgi:hypothetical protein